MFDFESSGAGSWFCLTLFLCGRSSPDFQYYKLIWKVRFVHAGGKLPAAMNLLLRCPLIRTCYSVTVLEHGWYLSQSRLLRTHQHAIFVRSASSELSNFPLIELIAWTFRSAFKSTSAAGEHPAGFPGNATSSHILRIQLLWPQQHHNKLDCPIRSSKKTRGGRIACFDILKKRKTNYGNSYFPNTGILTAWGVPLV